MSRDSSQEADLEDFRKKQLSILLLDLRDTQEEMQNIREEMINGKLSCGILVQAMEEEHQTTEGEYLDSSEETKRQLLTQCLTKTVQEKSSVSPDQNRLVYQEHIHSKEEFSIKDSVSVSSQSIQDGSSDQVKTSETLEIKECVSDLRGQVRVLRTEKELLAARHGTPELFPRIGTYVIDPEKPYITNSPEILAEQVTSLENELRSKDLKITALQEDLDHLHHLLSEQENKISEKEDCMKSLLHGLNQSQSEEERLSELIDANKTEMVSLQEMVCNKTAEIENLHVHVAEISHSLSDKIVLLNEEKYSLAKEVKELKEKLNSQSPDNDVEMDESEVGLQLEKVLKEKSQLQEMLACAEREQLRLHEQLAIAQLEFREQAKKLHEKLMSAEREQENLHGQLEATQRDMADQARELHEKLMSAQMEQEKLHGELEAKEHDLTEQTRELHKKLMSAQMEQEKLHGQLEAKEHDLTEQTRELHEKLMSAQMEQEKLHGQLEAKEHDLTEQAAELQEKQTSTEMEQENIHAQLEAVKHDHTEQTRELQEQLTSTQREQDTLHVQQEPPRHESLKQVEITKIHQSVPEAPSIQTEGQITKPDTVPTMVVAKELPSMTGHEAGSDLRGIEELQDQLNNSRKENEHLKRKLQAALVNRKELLKKVSKLEKDRGKEDAERTYSVNNAEAPEENITKILLKQQLLERESELENVKQELVKNRFEEEKLQTLIKEMTLELSEKTELIQSLNSGMTESMPTNKNVMAEYQSSDSSCLIHSLNPEDTRVKLENRILSLEQDKENLQKKVQEALNSRRDTIKKAQEKDRHHREQLKQQKEEVNLLQERCEELQRNHNLLLCESEEPQKTDIPTPVSVMLLPVASEQNTQDSSWGCDWVDVSPMESESTLISPYSHSNEMIQENCKSQNDHFQTPREELVLRAEHLEKELVGRMEEASHLQDIVNNLTKSLQCEKKKYQESEFRIDALEKNLETSLLQSNHLQELESDISQLKEDLLLKKGEVENLSLLLEEKNTALENMRIFVLEKEDAIVALKSQQELQAKEHEHHCRELEMQIREVNQKQNDDVEEARSKEQLQRKLQAALISRKEALKESKSLKSELSTMRKHQQEVSNKLQAAENSLAQLSDEKAKLSEAFSRQQGERERLILEVDKCLIENQNLEISCESLKLALGGITQEKEMLEMDLMSVKNSQVSDISEYKEKLSDMQKEYEILLQSYENVGNETDRMKRAMEAVRQEKHEVLNKLKLVESAKVGVEKQLEEAEEEVEAMKEKMRKFAKSKQQKILELEEENEKLRGELQPISGEQQKEMDSTKSENATLQAELERIQSESQAFVAQIETLRHENTYLAQEVNDLRRQMKSAKDKCPRMLDDFMPESVTSTQNLPSSNIDQQVAEELTSHNLGTDHQEHPQTDNTQRIVEDRIIELENHTEIQKVEIEKWKSSFMALKEEKTNVDIIMAAAQDKVTDMQKKIAELGIKNQTFCNEIAELSKQKGIMAVEKDELEERLMNQLAELNGSIGNYQQDAVEYQIKNENMQRELQDLKFQLEEEKRQLERQKAEALSLVQREYVEKLKSVHEGEKGRKTQARELQELLKEKQQEVRHLQKDCIQYQETISGLERANKALTLVHSEYEKDKLACNETIAKVMEDKKQAQADLASLQELLDGTQSETAMVIAENTKLKNELQALGEDEASKLKSKEEDLEKRLEQVRDKHLKEMINMEERVNLLQLEKQQLEASINNLQSTVNGKNHEMKELQRHLNENIVKLAAFTRSMCSLQDDRDRIIDESRKWSQTFTETLQKKDDEIREKEKVCEALKDELTQVTVSAEELQIKVTRLELEIPELNATLQNETETHLRMQMSLQEENTVLSSRLEEVMRLHIISQDALKLQSIEAAQTQTQLKALEANVQQVETEKENLLGTLKKLEVEVQDLRLLNEQIKCDLHASKTLTEKLHLELEQKEQDVIGLLSARDEAVSATVAQLRDLHSAESMALEERLNEAEQERAHVQEKLETIIAQARTSQEEAVRSRIQLEALTKSMCSLQQERERILSDYQHLEQRHLNAILDKDGLIQEAAAESNKLREEMRCLQSRTDDLNAQNAKLNAHLTRYREDLKELISLKDLQLKQLLGEKLQDIERLRKEQSAQEQQLQQEREQRGKLQEMLELGAKEQQKMQQEVETLTLCASQLQSQKEAGEARLKQVEKEEQTLREEFLQLQQETVLIKEEASRVQNEAEQRAQRAEQELTKKLQTLQHDTGILRNETETAEERVAELARDLMEAEQRLLNANEENAALRAQLQAFEGSMRSLQDSHDFMSEELSRLQMEQENVSILQEELSIVSAEKDSLRKQVAEQREHTQRLQVRKVTSDREEERHVQTSNLRDRKEPSAEVMDSQDTVLQNLQEDVQNLRVQLRDSLTHVHQKELKIQQLNSKLSQVFEEKSALSLQLRGSHQNLRDAQNRSTSLQRQLQDLQPKRPELLLSDSAPGAPQERKEPDGDPQVKELQQRFLQLKQQNIEAEEARSDLERRLQEERERAEERVQELEGNMKRLQSQRWPSSDGSHELSLLIEPQEAVRSKSRSSSLRRLLHHLCLYRTRTPLLAALYLLTIHVLLLLCFTGHV
ncbi:golgin subfamily B member 1 [Discoglossus pictus]